MFTLIAFTNGSDTVWIAGRRAQKEATRLSHWPTVLGGDQVFLPIEGDNTLSIILSKAFLLADDTKISDRTITSQIGKK